MSRQLLALTRHRHAIPIMALLHRAHGAKFVTLVNRTGGSRASVRQALDHLLELGWVRRPTGHGHPLRPEYELTPEGLIVGEACVRVDGWLARRGLADVLLRRWPLPILAALTSGAERFSEIGRSLPGLTDRALSLTLASLVQAGLVTREVLDGRPPAVRYRPSPAARRLALQMTSEQD